MSGKIVYPFGGGLYVNLTNRCSNRCAFCVRARARGIGDNDLLLDAEPTADQVKRELDRAEFKKYSEVVFCGFGEPTERADVLTETAAYVHAAGVAVRLNTNGQGDLVAGRPLVPELKGKVDRVSISLNASDADRYDALCRSRYGKDAYDAIWRFAAACRDAGIAASMSVVDSVGTEEVARCRALCERAGIPLKVRVYIDDASEETGTRLAEES